MKLTDTERNDEMGLETGLCRNRTSRKATSG